MENNEKKKITTCNYNTLLYITVAILFVRFALSIKRFITNRHYLLNNPTQRESLLLDLSHIHIIRTALTMKLSYDEINISR